MKRSALFIMTLFLSLSFIPVHSRAESTTIPISRDATNPLESEQAKVLLLRLDQIQTMEKSDLKASEKRELRKEVRTIKHNLSELGGGVYISAGTLIIILVLLIILL